MEENTLKQADARFEVIGIISEMNLKVDTDTEGKEYIGGTIKIKTDETNTVVTDVRVNKVTKDGKENKTYDGWLTRMAEYESIADEGVDGATIVHIKKGQLRPSKYINKETGREVQGVRYSANFMNKVDRTYTEDGELDIAFKAEFHVTGYIQSIIDEFNKEEETGRLILNLQVPTFNSIEPLKLIVPENLADTVKDMWEMGATVDVDGKIVNRAIVTEKVIKRAIGDDVHETSTEYVNELLMTGGSAPYEEEFAYKEEAIRKAMADKQIALDEAKAKVEEDRKKGKNNGAVPKNTTATSRKLPTAGF